MKLNEYQELAMLSAIYPEVGSNIIYPALGLGEIGEVQGKIKKIIRDTDGIISEETKKEISKEIGDILWYISSISFELGFKLSDMVYPQKNYEFMEFQTLIDSLTSREKIDTNDYVLFSLALGIAGYIQYSIVDFFNDFDSHRLMKNDDLKQFLLNDEKVINNIGKLLYIISQLSTSLNLNLDCIARENIEKLQSRKERNVIKGNGDNR